MIRRPRFSIIIPTLNEEQFLPHLLRSLAAQSQKDFEVIVVDGSSKDNTVRVARSFSARLPSLKTITIAKPSLPAQRNLGAKAARGRWFVFVDADSVLLPYFVERLGWFIKAQKPTLVTSWFRPDSEEGGDAVLSLLANITVEGLVIFKRPLAPGPLTAVTRRAFEAMGGYNEAQAFNEDAEFSLRMHKRGVRLSILREVLYVWSLRRFRKQGTLRVLQQYAKAAFPVFFLGRPFKEMPGYLMGGHLYGKRRTIKRSTIKMYERKLKKLLKELFL